VNDVVSKNDGMNVNVWQDGGMDEQSPIREIGSVEELRALADPVRLAILSALDARVPGGELPVLSVKELAARLGESQTKLYRHVRQLEAAGLIEVAATRLVSGIQESRYRARQRDLRLSDALFRRHSDESEAAVRSVFDTFLTGAFAAGRREDWPAAGPGRPVLAASEMRVTPEAAERIRARLEEAGREIGAAEPGEVTISAVIGFYRAPD
jgi:DNA-binding transcriptional ArsR family regulator